MKETDRLAAMATELRKLGAQVEEGADFLRITPPGSSKPGVAIDTYDDHRMAMCFSLAALGGVPVRINDPECVAKTFPDYFDAFAEHPAGAMSAARSSPSTAPRPRARARSRSAGGRRRWASTTWKAARCTGWWRLLALRRGRPRGRGGARRLAAGHGRGLPGATKFSLKTRC